jgi:hypothetical protein
VELLIILVSLGAVGLLASRLGADSRDTVRSEEHDLARHGLVWQRVPVPARRAAPRGGPGV